MMKPQYERVTFPEGCSLRVYNRQVREIPFEWHHHPEYELTLTLNSRGWRFIGDHIAEYCAPDLVLVPPDMPHTWSSTSAIDNDKTHTAVVIWFSGNWANRLAEVCPEFAPLRRLLKQAVAGLAFSRAATSIVERRLPELLDGSPRIRLQAVLQILAELADAEAASLASSSVAGRPTTGAEPAQLSRVLEVLHKRFCDPLRIEDLCAVANLSERSLHRFFVRHVGESVSDYLGKLRIGRACMMLAQTDLPVAVVASESGFSNLANFNRRFRTARHMTPTAFRRYFLAHRSLPGAFGAAGVSERPPSLARRHLSQTRSPLARTPAKIPSGTLKHG
jgi:AraC-like DNA-binding protein